MTPQNTRKAETTAAKRQNRRMVSKLRRSKTRKELGIPQHDVPHFVSIGITSLSAMRKYVEIGIDGEAVAVYHKAGVTDRETIKYLHARGVTGERALQAVSEGFGPVNVANFGQIGITSFAVMRDYEDNGVSGIAAIAYHRAGYTTLDEMLELRALRVDHRFIEAYVSAGATTIEAAGELAKAWIQPVDIRCFQTQGVTDLAEMKAYTEAGLQGRHARGFLRFGIRDVDTIKKHIENGVCPEKLASYSQEIGTFVVEDMITLAAADVPVEDIDTYIIAGIRYVPYILAIREASKTNGVTTDELPWLFQELRQLGELGARITVSHPAAKTTVGCLIRTPELVDELNALDNRTLKGVIALAEDSDSITAEELRQLIEVMTT